MTEPILTADLLLGIWQLLRCEAPLEFQPGTQMQFGVDGVLTYVIPTPNGALRVPMQWRVGDGHLHTRHEDGTNPVVVRAAVGAADILTFDFDGPRAFFVRST